MNASLNQINRAALTACCQKQLALARSTDSTDREATKKAIKAFYQQILDKPVPPIIFCESPWQSVFMSTVLQKGWTKAEMKSSFMKDDSSLKVKKAEEAFRAVSMHWRSRKMIAGLWERLWERLERETTAGLRESLVQPQEPLKLTPASVIKLATAFSPFRTEPKAECWTALARAHDLVRTRLATEMNGVCDLRFGKDPELKSLKAQFDAELDAGLRWSPINQLRTDLMMSPMTEFNLSFVLDFPNRFSADNLRSIGWEIIRGNLQEQLDKVSSSDQKRHVEFLMASMMANTNTLFPRWRVDELPFFDFLQEQITAPELTVGPTNKIRMRIFADLSRCALAYAFFEKVCIVTESPVKIVLDERSRLHSERGPALAFTDAYNTYAWHGTAVPQFVIDDPKSLTAESILQHTNAEVRRAMIDRYGMGNFIADSGAIEIHRDECGILYRKDLPGDEPLVMVKVTNSTAEPDGSFKSYFLRVPPNMTNARTAVAWTFDLGHEEYEPTKQS